jgi:hypothetical protein
MPTATETAENKKQEQTHRKNVRHTLMKEETQIRNRETEEEPQRKELPLENFVHSVQYIQMPITHLPSSSHTLKASTNALQHV